MHVHSVYFWLNYTAPSLEFESGLDSLTQDPNVIAGYFGRPASTDRDVIDSSYSYGLVLVFEDRAAHDAYQEGAAHLTFLDDHLARWDKVVVHDIDT